MSEARLMRHPHVGNEHLLLGLARLGEPGRWPFRLPSRWRRPDPAALALTATGNTVEQLRASVREAVERSDRTG